MMKRGQAEEVLRNVAITVLDRASIETGNKLLGERTEEGEHSSNGVRNEFVGTSKVDELIADIRLGEWKAAEKAALKVIAMTNPSGKNLIFEALLDYQNCPDDDNRFWGATMTVECCLQLAPWLIDHTQLSRLAAHDNYSVRSGAACICMNLAHSAPDRVPIDVLLKLSVYNEDWYVETPANSAIKAMARTFPAVLNIFYGRMRSTIAEERNHAASAIRDIAEKEPWLLDSARLKSEFARLKKLGDSEASDQLKRVLRKIEGVKQNSPYRYGL